MASMTGFPAIVIHRANDRWSESLGKLQPGELAVAGHAVSTLRGGRGEIVISIGSPQGVLYCGNGALDSCRILGRDHSSSRSQAQPRIESNTRMGRAKPDVMLLDSVSGHDKNQKLRLGQITLYSIGVYLDVQTVVETPAFLNDAQSLGIPDAERLAIVTWMAAHPDTGKVIEGTGGARKVRFAGKGKGKSGGYRVISFFSGTDVPVFLLNIFAKNEKSDLTPGERRALKNILADIVKVYRGGKEAK